MSGTHLYYNGVLLRDCELLEFDQLIEKDKSGTDPLYSRFRITVASTLVSLLGMDDYTPPTTDIHLSTIASPLPARNFLVDRLHGIQEKLQEFRKDFWFAINGSSYRTLAAVDDAPVDTDASNSPYRIVLAATGLLTDVSIAGKVGHYFTGKETDIDRVDVIDADNGPKPSNVRITKIDGGRAMRVQMTIEVCRCVCGEESDYTAPPVRDATRVEGVISNRWSVRETIDETWRTSFTIEGVLVISDQRYKADSMRLMTSQHLIPYAKLTGREFFVAEDGLTLRYRYSMQEVGAAPPPLIVDWEGTYTEKSDQSAITMSTINAKIKGTVTPPNGWTLELYKSYMMDVLLKLITSRITLDGNNPGKLPGTNPHEHIIKDFTIIETMNKPELAINVIVQNQADEMFSDFQLRLFNLGKAMEFIGYDEKWWPIPSAYTWDTETMRREKSLLGSAYDAFYQSPCSEWHGKPRGMFVDDAKERAGDTIYVYTEISGPPTLTNYVPFPTYTPGGGSPEQFNWSEDQVTKGASYISVEAENRYEGNRGKMVLPLSKARASSSGTQTLVVIPVHAGVTMRSFTMVCSRDNDWPKVPAPKEVLALSGKPIETLVSAVVLPEAPKLGTDGKTFTYTVQCKFDYAVSNTPTEFKVPRDPRVKPISGLTGAPIESDLRLPIAYLYDYSGKIEETGSA